MKFVIMDQIKNGDCFSEEFDDLKKALEAAKVEWDSLSPHDKQRRESFILLESENPDPDAINHLDGEIIWKAE